MEGKNVNRGLAAVAVAVLATACASPSEKQAMTQAAPSAMAQAPAPQPQPVHTPLPPPTKTAVPDPAPASAAPPAPAAAPAAPPATRATPAAARSGPYVRLEVGHSVARRADFRDNDANAANCFIVTTPSGACGAALNHLGSSTTYGIGVGYNFGNGFRGDISYGHREGYNLRGRDPQDTDFDPPVSSKSLLVSGYYDFPMLLGTVQPYAGGGFGRSDNHMSSLKWHDTSSSGVLPGGKNNALAWQFSVGANVFLPADLVLEFGYRYMDMGKFKKAAGPDLQGQFHGPGVGTGPASGRLRADEIFLSLRRGF